MRLRHIYYLGVKELRSLARDPIMLILIAYSFTLAIYVAATAMPDSLNKAATAVVDEDRSPLSSRMIDSLQPPYFMPPPYLTPAEMDARMDQGLITFAIDIPPNFQRDMLAGNSPTVQLNVDATRISQAFVGSGYIQSILGLEAVAFAQRRRSDIVLPVDLNLRARFNPTLEKSWFGSIAELIEQVTMLSIILTGAALIREREHGTVEHLLVMPVTPFEIMLSKVWSMALVVLVACAASLLGIVQGILSVPIQGSVVLFLAGAAVNLFAMTSLGIFLATVARSMPQFALLTILVIVPLIMLSGGVTPHESMPELVQTIMLAAPTTHFVSLAQGVLFRGAGWSTVWPQFLATAASGTVLFMIALVRFRKTISEMA